MGIPRSLAQIENRPSRSGRSIRVSRRLIELEKKEEGSLTKLQTAGDKNNISTADDAYNIYLDADEEMLNFINNDFKVQTFTELKDHYLYNH